MRPLDWRAVLEQHHIPFIERGPNVKRGEISVQCPFCGSADPSKHMGINLETGFWCCWRNASTHKGKSPLRLLVALLNVPYWRAREIAGLSNDEAAHDPEGFDATVARIMQRGALQRPEQVQRRHLKFDKEFQPFDGRAAQRRFVTYLTNRGFPKWDVSDLAKQYSLHYATTGDFQDRIVLPYYLDGELVTWTARAITQSTIRYKDLSVDESLVPPKQTLFNHDCILKGGEILIVQEGPFDALKLDFYGQPYVRSVALSTNSVSDEQAHMLQAASSKFTYIKVVMDMATSLGVVDSMKLKQQLAFLPNVTVEKVPFGAKDGGDLTRVEVRAWSQILRDLP